MPLQKVCLPQSGSEASLISADLEFRIAQLCLEEDILLLIISVDLANDVNWDLAKPTSFSVLDEGIREGLLDALFGGPPCSTCLLP